MDKGLITVGEASEMAQITVGYIRRMFINDKFKDLKKEKDYWKMGKVWVIKRNAWEKHLKNIENKNKVVE